MGFLTHPRRDVFYVRTARRLRGTDRNESEERDLLAIKVELVRRWVLFLPTFLALAFLIFFAAAGPMKFSVLNWTFSHSEILVAALGVVLRLRPLLVFIMLPAWISEKWVEGCRGVQRTVFSIFRSHAGGVER